ncbi:TVP38/TMEM64 family protein [Neobacillus sp. D3-1R]|uniref:TVP38/TMEM64 family protein n=1 Tax=Neobacillus sp. D3-1R TaxID=3445778 RepID=UPI003FA14ABC
MMEEIYWEWMPESKLLFVLLSIIVNVVIAISGILPSAFLTAANIAVLDFKIGLIISIFGEAVGAIISFILYRKGISKLSNEGPLKNKILTRLHHSTGLEAVFLVLVLRILPFIPSGVVTLYAAYSKMGIFSFGLASTIGKVPSLLMEAYATDRALQLSSGWKLSLIALFVLTSLLFYICKKRRK